MKTIKIFLALSAIFSICYFAVPQKTIDFNSVYKAPSESPGARKEWDKKRLVNPATGNTPNHIRVNELKFAQDLPNDLGNTNLEWVAQGPFNVGGRTRAVSMDVLDENHLVAGGASGGIWTSADFGESWTKRTQSFQLHNVTCIDQDTRSGKENIWYHGTGELTGSSASGGDAYFDGNGIYKSIDNGLTWDSIPFTSDNNAAGGFNIWDFIWNVALDPTNLEEDEMYAATYGSVHRSIDGGENWTEELGGGNAYYNNVEVTSTGVVYASLSSDGTDAGIWRSANGTEWANILPDSFPTVFGRTAIGINPTNENEIYFLTAETEGGGQYTETFFNGETWTSLWKYTYLCNDGLDTCAVWENLSANIPANRPTTFDNFNAQGGYDLLVKVKPGNEDVVFIGGTNLWRSTDGFSSDNNTTQVGGYYEGSNHGYDNWDIYDKHHPDQHELLFLPSDPNKVISGNDGGIFFSDNCNATPHVWKRMNNGYQTTQLYSVTMAKGNSEIVLGGFQDNGNFMTFSDDPEAIWTMPFNGDGSYNAIADNEEDYYLQIQRGVLFKMKLNNEGEVLAYNRMDPLGADTSSYEFINYLAMDPNDDDILYFPNKYNLWRNNTAGDFAYNNSQIRTNDGWEVFSDTTKREITCIDVSTTPANVVYLGTSGKYLYRIDDANTGDPTFTQISNLPTDFDANISAIEIDPTDVNRVLVLTSNYTIYSLFFTNNGGESWERVGGNLEDNLAGGGNGPSMRSAEIAVLGTDTLYLAAGSTGLYGTPHLRDHANTVWTQIGTAQFGGVVVENIRFRASDGKLLVGTHGTGVYTTTIESIYDVFPDYVSITKQKDFELNIYPNPSTEFCTVEWKKEMQTATLKNIEGKTINEWSLDNVKQLKIKTKTLMPGVYFITLSAENDKVTKKIVVQ